MINKGLFTSNSCEWETPQEVFDRLNRQYHFTLDPCATKENAKCEKYYTREQDGLKQDWAGETVFCNPPYGKEMPKWIEKCARHAEEGGVAVMLIPARTDTRAFHDYIYHRAEIQFLRGRLRYGNSKWNAPFPSMVVVFNANRVICPLCGTAFQSVMKMEAGGNDDG